jgi:deoxycytidylate deaminase
MSKRIKKMMQLAYSEAIKSKVPNRHGCVIARGGKVLASSYNKAKTHPIARHHYSQMLHAEAACIIALDEQDLRGSDMYVCRVMRTDGLFGMSRPCSSCGRIIVASGIRNVFYTDNEGNCQHYEV